MVTRKQNIGGSIAINDRRRSLMVAGSGLIASGLLRPVFAQTQAWPNKPIKLVAAQAPGSSNDASARAFAEYFTSKLGVSVVVENKPGGLGMIAAESVARATDGHTFLITLHSQLAQAPVLLKKPPIDPSKDLVPIGAIGVGPVIAAVNKDLSVRNLAEFLELARKRPVSVGNYAIGSGWQLMLAKLMKDHSLQFNVANYRGTGAMLMDLYGGQIEAGAGSLAGLGAGVQNGSIRPIVIIIGSRSSRLPGIPTWVEAGFKGPAFEDLAECNMLLGPSGTPSEVIERLGSLIQDSVKDSPRVKAVRESLAADDIPLTGVALQQFIRKTWPSYQALTREMDFKLE